MFLPLTVQFIWAGKAQEEQHSPGHKSAVLQTAQTTLGFSEQAHFSTPLGKAPPTVRSFSHRFLLKNNFGNIIVPSSKAVLFPPPWVDSPCRGTSSISALKSHYQNSNSLITRNVIPLPQRHGSPGSPLLSKSCRDTLGTHLDSVHHSMLIRSRCLPDRSLEI